MAGLVMIGALLAVVGYYLLLAHPATKLAKDAPSAEVVAADILVYQKAAVDWCLRGPCADGPVPSAALVLPPGYGLPPWLAAQAEGGRVSTYAAPPGIAAVGIAASLTDLAAGSPTAGLSTADGTIETAATAPGRPPLALPAGIPAGVAVISQKVK